MKNYIDPIFHGLSLYDLINILHSVQDCESKALFKANEYLLRALHDDVTYHREIADYYKNLAQKIEIIIGGISPR